MLHNYEICLDHFHGYEEVDILNDDAEFSIALQKYKNIVTHYHAAKVEIWMGLFMKPVHDVEDGVLSFEFSPSRGAIHFHSLLQTKKNVSSSAILEALKVRY